MLFRRNLTAVSAVFIAGCLSVLFIADVSFAHNYWLESTRYRLAKKSVKPMLVGWGHHLPVDDGMRGEKIDYIRVVAPDGSVTDVDILPGKSLHSYMISYDKPGTYCLASQTKPGYYTMYTDTKGRKRHKAKPKSALSDIADIRLSVFSSQFAKAYVVMETSSDSFARPAGLELELMPLKDPYLLSPGDTLPFQVLFRGKPYAGAGEWMATWSGYSTEAETYVHMPLKIEGGRFDVPITHAGNWFVKFDIKIPSSGEEAKQCDHIKYKSTVTFQVVAPEQRKAPAH